MQAGFRLLTSHLAGNRTQIAHIDTTLLKVKVEMCGVRTSLGWSELKSELDQIFFVAFFFVLGIVIKAERLDCVDP
jgi:hypothetical protein